MIIKVYGQFWSRDRVNWATRELLGVRKGKKRCDIWDQRGIYALYKDFQVVYVGQADSRGIGVRLAEHRTDRFAQRWDSFSFFGICEVDQHGKAKPAKKVTVPPTSLIKSLELIGILLSDAPLNRARGKFPDSEKVRQIEAKVEPKSQNNNIDQMLSDLASRVGELQNALAHKNKKIKPS
jgi:hypothetical protein